MDRKTFLKSLGIGASAAVLAPKLLSKPEEIKECTPLDQECKGGVEYGKVEKIYMSDMDFETMLKKTTTRDENGNFYLRVSE